MDSLPAALAPSSEIDKNKGKLNQIAGPALLGLLSTALIVLYASIGRPLWIDEFLHFAFGGFTSTLSAWLAMRHSIHAWNFGQTGVYMLVDYWLLKLFGANLIALRLPSLLSAGLMLWAGFEFLTKRRYGTLWQITLIVCYLGQTTLMYYTGEARPYMPLAGASVGAFTYYILTPEERGSRSIRILGWLSILWGAAVHPYFAFYWLSLYAFGFLMAVYEERATFSWKSALHHLNAPLAVIGSVIYFWIGFATWIRHDSKLYFYPFQYISKAKFYETFVDLCHFQFLGKLGSSWLLFTVILCLVHFCLNADAKPFSKRLLPACLLIWVVMLLSVFISWESFKHHYWILMRQWVASLALIPIAFVWFGAELTNLISRVSKNGRWLIPVICLCVVAWCSYPQTLDQWHTFLAAIVKHPSSEHFVAPQLDALPRNGDEWVVLANQNVESGGPVWLVFSVYYGGTGK